MKIGEKKFVTLSYTLTVDGSVADSATAENPLGFVFGAGYLLPEFEKNIDGLSAGRSSSLRSPRRTVTVCPIPIW